MTPAQLKATLKRLGLNHSEAARRLGVTPRAMRFWLAGTYPVPESVALLLRAWEKEQKPQSRRRRSK